MNTEDFTILTANPNTVTKEQVIFLEAILEEFPYFQIAHAIRLKGLKTQRNFKYNNTLKKVAAYTTNRTVLFDFITADVLDYEIDIKRETDLLHEIEVVDSKVIEHLYESITASKEDKITIDVEEKKIQEATEIDEKIKIEEEKLEIGTPIKFNKNDSFSFSEWLQIKQNKPIERKAEVVIEKKESIKQVNIKNEKLVGKLDLIEKFILNKPKVKPVKTQENIDISIESTQENVSLMTETLARVYLEQKKYNQAISAFKILSLKYPEKSSFFADRIKAIKFLQKYKS